MKNLSRFSKWRKASFIQCQNGDKSI